MLVKDRLKIKASCGCELCDFGYIPDGPAGHEINGVWMACPLHPRRAPTYEERVRSISNFEASTKKLGRPRKQADRITPLPVI